jgi:hypothetical protein
MSLFRPDASIFPAPLPAPSSAAQPAGCLLDQILTLRETATASRQPEVAGQRR